MDALTPARHQAVVDSLNSIIPRQWQEARAADDKLIKQMEQEGSVYRVADDAASAEWKARADTAKKAYTDKYPEVVKQEIGRAHVCTPVTNAQLVCRLLIEQKKTQPPTQTQTTK